MNESMFEENTSNFKLVTGVVKGERDKYEIGDIERNPLNLQPLYINEENLKKYLPDKEFANQILGCGKDVQGSWPVYEETPSEHKEDLNF